MDASPEAAGAAAAGAPPPLGVMFLTVLIDSAGVGLIMPASGADRALAFAAMYACRRGAEEAMTVDQFGEAYRRYAARVPRLFPRPRGNGR